MRLLRLELHGFRSYSDPTEVVFEPGVNVFAGRNESGKTGILLGVQVALFPPRLGADREAFASEGSEICRVSLEYELPAGGRFRVERDLLAHRGSIAECRDGSWLVLATAVGDIAHLVREHTGCDEALFRATLLVRHENVEIGDGADLVRSLSERLEILVSGSPGGVSAARAVGKLEAGVRELSGPRAGLVTAAEGRLREAEALLASAQSGARRLADGRPRLEELSVRAAALQEELVDGEAVLERARRVAGLEAKRAELRAGRAAIDRALDARAELVRLHGEALAARALAPEPVPPLPVPNRRSWSTARLAVIAAGCLLALAGVAAFFLASPAAGAALLLTGAVVAGAGLLAVRGGAAPVTASAAATEAERRAREAERRRDLAEGAAGSLDPRPEAELAADRARLGRDLAEVEAALAEAAIHRLEPPELARLEIRAQQLPGLIRAATEAQIRCEFELQALESASGSLAELEDEVEVARRELDRLRLRLAAMRLARDELEGAVADIREGVGPELAEEASRNLASIAPGYSVVLSEGAGLGFLPAAADGRPLGRRELSDGTLDQFHFAVRVALAGVLLGDLRPPLLLDDPFRYADADRRRALHSMLAEIAAGRQVLFFTVEDPDPLPVTHRLPVLASRVRST